MGVTPPRPDLERHAGDFIPRRPDVLMNGWMREVLSPWALEQLHAAGRRYMERGVRANYTGKIKRVVRYTIGPKGNGIWIHYHPNDSKWGPDYRTVFFGGWKAWARADRWHQENPGKEGNPWLVESRRPEPSSRTTCEARPPSQLHSEQGSCSYPRSRT